MSKKQTVTSVSELDELGLTGRTRSVNIAAWVLSAFVIVAGVVALVLTGKKIFILFIVLGILTPLNVLAYDNLVLKPKIARLKKAEQEAATTRPGPDETHDAVQEPKQ